VVRPSVHQFARWSQSRQAYTSTKLPFLTYTIFHRSHMHSCLVACGTLKLFNN
jgi:hypothetical protein